MSDDKPQRFWLKAEISRDDWDAFGDAVNSMHPSGRGERSQVLRDFIRWYMRRPGAAALTRPPAGDWSQVDSP
ncbi:hypothetical protein ACFVFF_23180 [Streptomyces sp. NPDC057680]|uniref:hypothetical protein n=1 Tax=Streptomyces sp. NPDC057680 TaxID=3346208 RepID=UPI0036CDE021